MNYNFHWRPVFKDLPDLLDAALLTLEVAALSMILGVLIGLGLSLIRIHMKGPVKWFATAWVELARNTPALLQLFFLRIWPGGVRNSFQPLPDRADGADFQQCGLPGRKFPGRFQCNTGYANARFPQFGDDRFSGLYQNYNSAGPTHRLSPNDQPDGLGRVDVISGYARRFSRTFRRNPVLCLQDLSYF